MNLPDALLLLVYAALVLGPGALIGAAAGLRGWRLLAAAGPLTYGVVAIGGPLTASIGVRWSAWPLLAGTVLFAVLAAGLHLATYRFGWSRGRTAGVWLVREQWLVVAATGLGTLVGGYAVLRGIGHLGAVPQDWDAIFHANATRYIADSGDAAPSALAAVYRYDNPAGYFYPNAYHALAAVAYELTSWSGIDIPAVLDAQMVLLPGITALGLVALVRTWVPRPALAVAVPLVGVAFTGFPYDVLWRGPLLPYGMGVALLPGLLLIFYGLLTGDAPSGLLLTALGCVGMVGLHPSMVFTAAPLVLALVIARAAARPRRLLRDAGLLVIAGVVTAGLGISYLLGSLDSLSAIPMLGWPADSSPGAAVGDLFLLNHESAHPQLWLAVLLLIGLGGVRRLRGLFWFLAGMIPIGLLYVAAAAYEVEWVKELTRPWWNDRWRFVAVITLAFAVLAANGVVLLADLVRRWLAGARWLRWADSLRDRALPAVRHWPAQRTGAVALAAVLAVFLLLSHGCYARANAARMTVQYGDGPTVSDAKRHAMDVLATMVGPGDRVMNDRGDGSAWMYALDDVHPFLGHAIGDGPDLGTLSPDQQLLLNHFNRLDTDPLVRAAAQRLHLRWVFIGRGFVRPYFTRYDGLTGLDAVHSLTLVYDAPDAAIYRVNLP